jgi:hypothetical protein
MAKKRIQKIVKEYNEATPMEIFEGVRDNFIFGFLGATIVVFISTRMDLKHTFFVLWWRISALVIDVASSCRHQT